MNKANFIVDTDKCVACGKCVKVCPGGVLFLNHSKKAEIVDFKEFGWNGCWKCEHCLAVCPTGAISIFGHEPENSLPVADCATTAPVMDSLIANRHSCRRYKDKNVDAAIINGMLKQLASAPNGGNKQQVEFTLIDDKEPDETVPKACVLPDGGAGGAGRLSERFRKGGVRGYEAVGEDGSCRYAVLRGTAHFDSSRAAGTRGTCSGCVDCRDIFRIALCLSRAWGRDAYIPSGGAGADA